MLFSRILISVFFMSSYAFAGGVFEQRDALEIIDRVMNDCQVQVGEQSLELSSLSTKFANQFRFYTEPFDLIDDQRIEFHLFYVSRGRSSLLYDVTQVTLQPDEKGFMSWRAVEETYTLYSNEVALPNPLVMKTSAHNGGNTEVEVEVELTCDTTNWK